MINSYYGIQKALRKNAKEKVVDFDEHFNHKFDFQDSDQCVQGHQQGDSTQ
jgi:hypothetical protein